MPEENRGMPRRSNGESPQSSATIAKRLLTIRHTNVTKHECVGGALKKAIAIVNT
jgi:hypothetical protein